MVGETDGFYGVKVRQLDNECPYLEWELYTGPVRRREQRLVALIGCYLPHGGRSKETNVEGPNDKSVMVGVVRYLKPKQRQNVYERRLKISSG